MYCKLNFKILHSFIYLCFFNKKTAADKERTAISLTVAEEKLIARDKKIAELEEQLRLVNLLE